MVRLPSLALSTSNNSLETEEYLGSLVTLGGQTFNRLMLFGCSSSQCQMLRPQSWTILSFIPNQMRTDLLSFSGLVFEVEGQSLIANSRQQGDIARQVCDMLCLKNSSSRQRLKSGEVSVHVTTELMTSNGPDGFLSQTKVQILLKVTEGHNSKSVREQLIYIERNKVSEKVIVY